jgi:serine/threonine-protein kinase
MSQSTQTGNFEFLGVVEKPKAGVTYKVRNLTTGEFETLRSLPGASYSDPESLQRLLREMKVHTRLSHPNIVAFHDALELDGHLVMTAEFIEGTTLAELCRRGPLPSDQAIGIARDVLAGLEEAHSLGIVHRNVTAGHVMVTKLGETKLGGFGLAKPASDLNLTRAGAVVGDPRYMSPEQVAGINALDGRADLYSAGVLLFYMLTGRLAFDATNDFDVMLAQVQTQPPQPSSLNPLIAPELEAIILRALAKKPEERFASATDFRSALAALRSNLRVLTQVAPYGGSLPKTVDPDLFMGTGQGAPKRNLYVLGLVIAAIALIVFLVVAIR